MVLTILLLLLAVLYVGISLAVILNSPKRMSSITFAIFTLLTPIWLGSNALSLILTDPTIGLWVTRLITPVSATGVYVFVLFVLSFPKRVSWLDARTIMLLGLPLAVILALSPTSLNVSLVPNSQPLAYELGNLYSIYLVYMTLYITGGLVALIRRLRQSSGVARLQLTYVLVGWFMFMVPATVTGLILPAMGWNQLWDYSPLFSVFLFGFSGYAILKHRLFDVRIFVARSVTYVLLLSTFTVAYGLLLSLLSMSVIGSTADRSTVVISTVAAVIVALSFQPLKHYFDRFSNRLFYRDAYRLQSVVDEISHALVSTLDIGQIMQDSARSLSGAIKPAYIHITVFDDGTTKRAFSINFAKDVAFAQGVIDYAHHTGVEFLSPQSVPAPIAKWLKRYDCEYAVPMLSQGKCNGIILLGAKQSGSTYSRQDKELLSISANNIALAVENAKNYNQVSHFAETLQAEVERATGKLRRSNAALKRTSQAKDEFMSMASHQLRPQLAATLGFVQLLRRDIMTPRSHLTRERTELLGLAEESVARMSLLVGDMLNSSRFDSGSLKLVLSQFDICAVVKDEIRINARRLTNHKLEVKFTSTSPKMVITGDATKIREVIMNMFDNAIQYSPKDGAIEIHIEQAAGLVTFTIRDHGMGVPDDDQSKLFGKYFRAGNAINARPSGTGIGLYVAKRVVEEHGGTVLFDSSPDDGSTFGFTLPQPR